MARLLLVLVDEVLRHLDVEGVSLELLLHLVRHGIGLLRVLHQVLQVLLAHLHLPTQHPLHQVDPLGGLLNVSEALARSGDHLSQVQSRCGRLRLLLNLRPTVGEAGGTLLVRKLPDANPTSVYVGDVVVVKEPEKPENYLVRRLAAVEGHEMLSTDEKDQPFTLEKDQCWLLADNEKLKPKEAYDSRTFGPVSMSDIVGRAIYCLRSAVDHGPVQNSNFSMKRDSPILEIELDVDEMAKNHKA